MDKVYHPQAIESRWYSFWEEQGFFKANSEKAPGYCIMLPPPNVTGSLHMGHAFQDTIMDTLIRFNRMQGKNTLWQGGTDHAGIATQMVVERQLLQKGITRHDLGRDAFIEKVWEWKKESGNTISTQMRRLGASLDWDRERFTMDEGLSEAVKEVFIRLYEEGLIYKGKRLVNWDPKLHTAVSDLEVVSTEEQGHMWYLRYPVANQHRHIVIATTRPETMLGDVAVAVHPEDSRYSDLIGQSVQLPLCNRLIPIIADEAVDPDFGTGCVKITPAHDFNDYEMGKRHGLAMINIFDINAHINENAPIAYKGLERSQARTKIVADLEALGLVEKIEPHTLKIPRGDRSGVVVEPYLTDQWFVKVAPLAKQAIKAVESGQIKFVPENWSKTYFDWMHNIQDWCISRQLWWGHRIPAWTDQEGTIYVGRTEEEVRLKHDLGPNYPLSQETDVLDTWFSSALWPFSTLGWPENTKDLQQFYPTQVLVTGFDIIFFWVARMIMFGLKFLDKPPFHTVFVHGLIQDPDGQKMSKSKGNIIDPIDLIDGVDLATLIAKRTSGLMQPEMAKKVEKDTRKHFPDGIQAYGTDALRFTFLALATTGRHIRFDFGRIEGYRNFCNKIWNAARYVLMNVENQSLGDATTRRLSIADRWILDSMQKMKREVTQHIHDYRFDLLASSVYDFIWNSYCDWYLELSKPVLTSAEFTEEEKQGTRYTLVSVFEELLRVLHPLMPFITEEIWHRVAPPLGIQTEQKSIMMQEYPKANHKLEDTEACQALEWIKLLIMGIRTIRGEMNIPPSKQLNCFYFGGSAFEQNTLQTNLQFIKALAKIESIELINDKESLPSSASQLIGGLELFIPLKGLIDVDAETKRLAKEIEKFRKDQERSQNKLANEKYVANAPRSILEEEHRRLDEASRSISHLEDQMQKLANLKG